MKSPSDEMKAWLDNMLVPAIVEESFAVGWEGKANGILKLMPEPIPESLVRFLPAAIAVVTDLITGIFVAHHQPDYPGRFVLFQIVMFGAALLAAVRNKGIWFTGFSLLLAGVIVAGFSVGMFYLPTFFAALWVRVRD